MKRTDLIIATVVLVVAVITGLTLWNLNSQTRHIAKSDADILIGGSFTLVDQDGKTVTEKDFKGKPMLVYFGYTFCPDVCPTELQVMASALDQLGEAGSDIQPVLISIDPDRDKPEVIKEYIGNFHERLIGLTGSPEQIAAVAKLYRVYYSKVADKGGDANSYTMDHSSIVYLMDKNGNFIKHFNYGTSPENMAKGIKEALDR